MLSDDISVVSIISVGTYNEPSELPQGIILAYKYLNADYTTMKENLLVIWRKEDTDIGYMKVKYLTINPGTIALHVPYVPLIKWFINVMHLIHFHTRRIVLKICYLIANLITNHFTPHTPPQVNHELTCCRN